jgi:hypothetical protein
MKLTSSDLPERRSEGRSGIPRKGDAMTYQRPRIERGSDTSQAIQSAQNKGIFAVVDYFSYPLILFATPQAYEADE